MDELNESKRRNQDLTKRMYLLEADIANRSKYSKLITKELSLWHKLWVWFSNSYFFATQCRIYPFDISNYEISKSDISTVHKD